MEACKGGDGRPQQVRAANARVAREAARQKFHARLPMLCECDDADCDEVFLIRPEAFRAASASPGVTLTAPHHRLEGAQLEQKLPEYWLQRRP
ncbi:MAG TPA: hypothetical protein VLD16_15235 [Gaiellaceae bacterium]|nr:hypothetical protein [Gaiellaceae bacterium]